MRGWRAAKDWSTCSRRPTSWKTAVFAGPLNDLLKTLTKKNSGHIWFRVKANIAHCHLQLGDEATAADMLEEAVAHAPEDPKAAANAILATMLRL